MRILKATLLTSAILSTALHAEVQAVNIVLWDDKTVYNVPAGKTLIIEHFIWRLESGTTSQTVNINPSNDPGSGAFQLKFPDAPDSWTPTRPIRLAGGGTAFVSILFSNGGADWRDVMVCGLLVDNEDLYAAKIDTKMKDAREVGNTLVADLQYSSPRPRVTKVQSAGENFNFAKDVTAKLVGTSTKSADVVSVKKNGQDSQFMRVAVTTRSRE